MSNYDIFFLAFLQSTLIIVLFKIFTRYKIDNLQAIIVNYFVACLLGFALLNNFKKNSEIHEQLWFPFALIVGFFLMYAFIIFALSSQKAGISITAVSSKMSVIIPVSIGIYIYKDPFSILKGIGIILALTAFYFTFKKDKKSEINKKYIWLPVLLFIGTGTVLTPQMTGQNIQNILSIK